MLKKAAILLAIAASLVFAEKRDGGFKPFLYWGFLSSYPEAKFGTYLGWIDGFMAGYLAQTANAKDFEAAKQRILCLGNLENEQGIAMIDKYYKDHPEKWNNLFSTEIYNALTVPGSPCGRK